MKSSELRAIVREQLKRVLSESPRLSKFIWSMMGRPATTPKAYDTAHKKRMAAIDKHMNTTFKGVPADKILMYVFNTPQEAEKIKNVSTGVTGIWADDTTFLFHADQ